MRLLAILVFFGLALATGCSDHPGGQEEAEVHLRTGASNHTPEVGDLVAVNADVTTEGRVYFISFNWITVRGPAVPVFMNSTNTLTNVRFTEEGEYTIIMRVYWWDEDNRRRTTDSAVNFVVAPVPPVGGG